MSKVEVKPKRIGYMTGLTGECRKVEILDETVSGKFVIMPIGDYYGITMMLVPKAEIMEEKGE